VIIEVHEVPDAALDALVEAAPGDGRRPDREEWRQALAAALTQWENRPRDLDPEKLRSAEITLATIRDHAERNTSLPAGVFRNDHARGYESALRDVLAILDARWLPEGAPVNLPGWS
jgi:hypothetical protein